MLGFKVWIFALSTCGALASACQIPAPGEFDATPVYALVLDSLRTRFTPEAPLVIDTTLFGRPSLDDLSAVGATLSLLRAYAWANSPPRPTSQDLARRLGLPLLDYTSPPADDPTSVDLDEWWSGLESRYGEGVILVGFSHPGFSEDGASAVLHYEFQCDDFSGFCAEAHTALVRFVDGRWVFDSDFLYIIS